MNEHKWLTGAQHCDHEELTGPPKDTDGTELQYFRRGESAFSALRKVVTDKRWLKSLKYYTKFQFVIYYIFQLIRHFVGIQVYWKVFTVNFCPTVPNELLFSEKCL